MPGDQDGCGTGSAVNLKLSYVNLAQMNQDYLLKDRHSTSSISLHESDSEDAAPTAPSTYISLEIDMVTCGHPIFDGSNESAVQKSIITGESETYE